MRTAKWWSLLLLVGFAMPGLPSASAASVAGYNENAHLTVSLATSFSITVSGQRTFDHFGFGFPNEIPPTTTYDPVANTTAVTFSGSQITSGTVVPPETVPGLVHFGYTVSADTRNTYGLGPPDTLSKVWSLSGQTVESVAAGFTIGLTNLVGFAQGSHYVLVNIQALPVVGGLSVQDILAIPIGTALSATLNIADASGEALQVASTPTAMVVPDTFLDPLGDQDPNFNTVMLGQLNDQNPNLANLPPIPGVTAGLVIPAGGFISAPIVPEPGSLIPFSLGILGLFGLVLSKHDFGGGKRAQSD